MSETNAAVEQALKTRESLEAALQVTGAMTEIKKKLLKELREDILVKVTERGWGLIWDKELESEYAKGFSGFEISYQLKNELPYKLRFQFEHVNLQSFMYGVLHHPKRTEIAELMGKAGLGPGNASDEAWSWWVDVEDDLQNWRTSKLPWLRIKDDSLVVWIMKVAETCYKTLGKMD